ncbi:MAG TPA: periplasmic heavy metal sensor [Bacteroidales bacterium]|nr:periplasmic heavy metal sensor [Bacteroidales bacterium]
MSYFNRSRLFLWILGAVLIINLAVTGTIIYKMSHEPKRVHHKFTTGRPCAQEFLESELHLTPAQAGEFRQLKKSHHDSITALHRIMKEKRAIISDNMIRPEPDTALIYTTTEELGALFARTRRLYIQHYFDLRNVCNPAQQEKLSRIYSRIFCGEEGCMKPPDSNCNNLKKAHRCDQQHL